MARRNILASLILYLLGENTNARERERGRLVKCQQCDSTSGAFAVRMAANLHTPLKQYTSAHKKAHKLTGTQTSAQTNEHSLHGKAQTQTEWRTNLSARMRSGECGRESRQLF